MIQGNRFISPGAWFAMTYPAAWHEFEDGEDSFLFYNPDEWTGNFRISAYRGGVAYGTETMCQELTDTPLSKEVKIGKWACVYSQDPLEEDGERYVVHVWVIGADDMVFECSFTTRLGASITEAEQIIATLEARKPGVKYPAEVIPVRLAEISQINEAYEWVERHVKNQLSKDFQGIEEDIPNMQVLIEQEHFSPKRREIWLYWGIVLCVILSNEVDGLEWRTLIDGNREAPILVRLDDGKQIDPMKLVWSKVKAGQPVDLSKIYCDIWG